MFDLAVIPMTETTALTPTERDAYVGQVANEYARRDVFEEYQSRKADNTLRAQRANMETFAEYLAMVSIVRTADQLLSEPAAWQGITFGLVEGFRNWMLRDGYAVSTVNHKLSTVKVYAKLAAKAGAITQTEKLLILDVNGYTGKDAKRIDERREVTSKDRKKAEHTAITDRQAEALKAQPDDTPQGRRDAVLMCLLLDHGLRASEVAALQVTDFDLAAGTMTFYRPKVDKTQTHNLTGDTLGALRAYFNHGDAPAMGELMRGSRKGGQLSGAGWSPVNISLRVRTLGQEIGIDNLSAHDCRHHWATYWAKRVDKLPKGLFTLQEAGGWSSLVMPRRYVEEAATANEGMA